MEDLLDLYEEPHDPRFPVVCFDETPAQLIEETRNPIPCSEGHPNRYDYEYRRLGVKNLFMFVCPKGGKRHVEITERKTFEDFAKCMKQMVNELWPEADKIRLVMDNYSTHKLSALYTHFSAEEARQIIKKIDVHYTPIHASWLNQAEIEISVLSKQSLGKRTGNENCLQRSVTAWQEERNRLRKTINWKFTTPLARQKLGRHYPS